MLTIDIDYRDRRASYWGVSSLFQYAADQSLRRRIGRMEEGGCEQKCGSPRHVMSRGEACAIRREVSGIIKRTTRHKARSLPPRPYKSLKRSIQLAKMVDRALRKD